MSSTYFQWGGFPHPDYEMNLASFVCRARLSPRGKILSHVYTMRLEGEIQETGGASAMTGRINAIIGAYFTNNQDANFYVNGTLTPHRMPNASSISGVKVLELAHPRGDAAEYANKRTVAVVIQGEYDAPESQLVDWQESVRWIGNTGARAEWFHGFLRPRLQRLCGATTMQLIQTGLAVGYMGYITPPGPIYPLIEHIDRRIIGHGTPRSIGQALRFYPTEWTYFHETDLYTEAFPNIR